MSQNTPSVIFLDLEAIDFARSNVRVWGTNNEYEGIVQIQTSNESEWSTMCFSSVTKVSTVKYKVLSRILELFLSARYGRAWMIPIVD